MQIVQGYRIVPLHVLRNVDALTLVGSDNADLLGLNSSTQELRHNLLDSSRFTAAHTFGTQRTR